MKLFLNPPKGLLPKTLYFRKSMGIKLRHTLQLALAPAVATSTIFASSANAATFSFSQVSLELDNFNQSPQDISADTDVSSIAISDDGLVTADVNFDSIFFADSSQVFINSESESSASGEGDRFFGQAQFFSELVGIFDVSASQDLEFDFEVSLNLENSVESPQSGSISTSGSASFFLIDNFSQEFLGIFDVFGALNTNLTNDPGDISPLFQISDNILVTDVFSQNSFGDLQESAQASLEGSFQQGFDDDTQLALIAFTTSESCVQAPQADDACVQIPEPSNILALMVVGSWLSVLSGVMKQVIQLAR